MKIDKIDKVGNIYTITKKPNLIEKLFGFKKVTERYKNNGEVFQHFPHIKVFYKSDGSQLEWNDKICKVLNNFDRKF